MAWQFHSRAPVYLQIVSRIRADILEGKYQADEQVPSVRQLAIEAAVNPNTVQRALTELEREGLLYARSTTGRFVTSDSEVLSRARETMHKEAMARFLADALALGITEEEFVTFIKQSKEGR